MAVRIKKTHPVKKRIINFLTLNSGYKKADEELVDLYVETYDYYQKMREELKENDMLIEYTNKAGATNLTKNPLIAEINKCVQIMSNLLKMMGLTPGQRKVVDGDEDDEFARF